MVHEQDALQRNGLHIMSHLCDTQNLRLHIHVQKIWDNSPGFVFLETYLDTPEQMFECQAAEQPGGPFAHISAALQPPNLPSNRYSSAQGTPDWLNQAALQAVSPFS